MQGEIQDLEIKILKNSVDKLEYFVILTSELVLSRDFIAANSALQLDAMME
jgi:hypothetical protein